MTAPRQMTAETLNALKGWPSQTALDYEAKLDSSVTDRVPAGTVVHVDPTSKAFVLGCDDALNPMPLFLFSGSDDPDVVNDGGDPATERAFVPISPSGTMMALVATGAYELVSTAYTDGTYEINDKLTSDGDGVLIAGILGTNVICGVVSRAHNADGTVDNGYGTTALAFWPVFLPVYPSEG